MKCPYCQNEMERGNIKFNTPLKLKWSSEESDKKVDVTSKIKITKARTIDSVYHCLDCNIIIKN